jgi:dATP/dGTP diphosphohydrolase
MIAVAATEAGKKDDQGKEPVVSGVFAYFPRALLALARISSYGARKYELKYSDKNWEKVDNAPERYQDAEGRHLLKQFIDGPQDPESLEPHLAHKAWNALAVLELYLKDAGH